MNPEDPDIIVGGFIEFRARKCGLIRSTDGGASWRILEATPEIPPSPTAWPTTPTSSTPRLAWGRNNTLYLATHAWDETTRNQTSVIVAKSTDLGDSRDGAKTFEEPVSAIGNVFQDAALRELPLTARTTTTAGPGTTAG